MSDSPPETVYALVGEQFFAELVERFYEGVAGDAVLRPLYPSEDFTDAKARLCGFLRDESPKVVDLQPAEYAAATFGSALFAFYSEQGLLTDIDGAEIDTLAAQGCPGVTATLLVPLGATSFADLLSR